MWSKFSGTGTARPPDIVGSGRTSVILPGSGCTTPPARSLSSSGGSCSSGGGWTSPPERSQGRAHGSPRGAPRRIRAWPQSHQWWPDPPRPACQYLLSVVGEDMMRAGAGDAFLPRETAPPREHVPYHCRRLCDGGSNSLRGPARVRDFPLAAQDLHEASCLVQRCVGVPDKVTDVSPCDRGGRPGGPRQSAVERGCPAPPRRGRGAGGAQVGRG